MAEAKFLKIVIVSLWLVSLPLAGCHKQEEHPDITVLPNLKETPPVSLSGPPDLLAGSEEGFADFSFHISRVQKEKGRTRLLAEATSAGKPIKITVLLSGSWDVQKSESPVQLRGGEVSFESIGTESDNLIPAMSQGYQIASPPKAMAKQIPALGLSLEGNPANLEREACKIKVFLNEEGAADYAEAFCNIDLQHKRLTLVEKDTSYRKALWRCFTGEAQTEHRSSDTQPVRVYQTNIKKN